MSETELLWTMLAFAYSIGGVYLKAFDDSYNPPKVWLPFIGVGGAIFLLINAEYFWGPETAALVYIEYMAILSIGLAGGGMFHLALDYTRQRKELERYRHHNQTTIDDHNDD